MNESKCFQNYKVINHNVDNIKKNLINTVEKYSLIREKF